VEVIKRKILLEDLISRSPDASYGAITATTIYINFNLSQTIDDLGIGTDVPFINGDWLTKPTTINGLPNIDNYLVAKLIDDGVTNPFIAWDNPPTMVHSGDTSTLRLSGSNLEYYFDKAGKITYLTDTKETSVRTYSDTDPFIVGFNVDSETYTNYEGIIIDGVNRVVQRLVNGLRYTIDANDDANIGTTSQTTGISYTDDNLNRREVLHTDTNTRYNIPTTTGQFYSEGWNVTNTSLYATAKEEYLVGISEPPEVLSDIDIDRGQLSVLDKHMRLSEIKTIDDLVKYGNGYYNIKK